MAIATGTYTLGPDDGALRVNTTRKGAAAKAGHDLTIEVGAWSATLQIGEDGSGALELTADSRSMRVLEGTGGMKKLDDEDKDGISQTIDEEVLMGGNIAFRSSSLAVDGDRAHVEGTLDLLGTEAPIAFDLIAADGRLTGSATVTQTQWGMKPYSALFGTLKLADDVVVSVDVAVGAA
jgi:polyisoprenoid-binding protein YceI